MSAMLLRAMLTAALLRMGRRTTRFRSTRLRPELLMELRLPADLRRLTKLRLPVDLRRLTKLRLPMGLWPLRWTEVAALEATLRTRRGPLLRRALEALLWP
ncbi:MAG: hypothetical protein ACRET5_00255, partial [Steroidobacteraceae bacterium]